MKLKVGKYVNTHGIKGEIRLLSNFSRKDLVFTSGVKIYIKDKEFVIDSYRHHKEFDMLKLKGINNINDILDLKGNDVYVDSSIIDEFIDEDLVNYKVIINNKTYKIIDVIKNYKQIIIVLDNNSKIPFVDEFIVSKDDKNKVIVMNVLDGLM